MTANPRRVYIVLCQSWTRDKKRYHGDDCPIKAFTSLEQAEQYVVRCQAAERRRHNPGPKTETRFSIVPMMVTEDSESPDVSGGAFDSGGCLRDPRLF